MRIEAYKVLARHEDSSVYSRVIKGQKFVLDMVRSNAPPLVYASRQGVPRLAIFGIETTLNNPIMFSAMDNRFSISSNADGNDVTLFYRGPRVDKPVVIKSGPELSEIARRLGGEGEPGEYTLDFSYADVVALMQSMIQGQNVSGAVGADGARQLAAFVLQDPPRIQSEIDNAPLGDNGRPQTDSAAPATQASSQGGVSGLDSREVK